jgi:hypothetical protein
MKLARRVSRLERIQAPTRPPRIVVRYEGPGSENLPQPADEDIDENDHVIVVRFVSAKDVCPSPPL